jgi:MFS family permease
MVWGIANVCARVWRYNSLMMFGVVFCGLHMGFTQGLLATLVADTAPAELRCTAFGVFNLVTGGVLLVASVLAGWLCDASSPAPSFRALQLSSLPSA